MENTSPKDTEPIDNPICSRPVFGRILKYDQSGRSLRILPFRRVRDGARQVSVLTELTVGERGILVSLELPENVQNHLMHMGFVPGSCVVALRRAPAGDPTVYCVDGLEIALRHETAEAIRVRPCTAHNVAANGLAAEPDSPDSSDSTDASSSQEETFIEAAQ
jgi:ferrous iron transport protein A